MRLTRRTSRSRSRSGTAVAGYNALFLYGLELAPASDGAIIVPGLAPVFSMLIAWPVVAERIRGRRAAGLLLAFAGVTR